MDFIATFRSKNGSTTTSTIPATSQADAEQFARSCAKHGYTLVSVTPAASNLAIASVPLPAESPYDFDGGFGIGGINRYQPTAAEELATIEAQIRHMEREEKRVRKGPLPHGQLWEPCPICGREPVCVDCGLCERHCDC